MKNILFLLDYYQENNSANGVCCRNVAECLAKKEYGVFVGCYRPLQAPAEQMQNGVHVIKTWTMPDGPVHKTLKGKISVYLRWLVPFSRRPAAAVRSREEAIYRSACRIIEDHGIDTVVCVHLPSETLLAGCRIKERYPQVCVCAYQLDTLSGGNLPRFLPQGYARERRIAWERQMFRSMDRVILMQSSRKHHLRYTPHEAWRNKAVYADVPLFVPSANATVCRHRQDGEVRISFAGTLSEGLRTPYHILEVLNRVKKYSVHVIFAGANDCRRKNYEIYSSLKVTELGLVEHEQALNLLNNADVLLSIGAKNTALLSGKIFEYMALGKPILETFWDDEDVTLPYLAKYPLALELDERTSDLDGQAASVEAFLDRCLDSHMDVSRLCMLFCENTPAYFEELFTAPILCKEDK